MERLLEPSFEQVLMKGDDEGDIVPMNVLDTYDVPGGRQDPNETLRHRDPKGAPYDDEDDPISVVNVPKDSKKITSLRDHERTSSLAKGIYNIINTTIGAGILTLPFQMRNVGMIPGVFLLLLIGTLSTFSLHLLNRIGQETKINSYMGVAHAAYGKLGQFIVAVSIWLLLISALSSYDNVVGSYLVSAVKFFRDVKQDVELKEWYFSSDFLSACVVLVVGLPLSLLPKFSKIAYASLACLFAIAYLTILMVYQFVFDVSQTTWTWPPITMARFDIVTFLPVLATIGMAYINQTSLYNVTAELKNPTPRRRFILIVLSNSVVLIVYVVFAIFGYLNFGDNSLDNILSNEPLDTLWTIARIAMAFILAFSIPLLTFPTRQCFDWLIHECYMLIQESREVPRESAIAYWDRAWKFRFVVEAVFILALSYGIAVAFGTLEKILEFFGSVTGSCIIYIFPCLFYMRIMRGGLRNSLCSRSWMDWACNLTLLIGMIIFSVGTIFSILKFFNTNF